MIYKYKVNIYDTSVKFIILAAGAPSILLIINDFEAAGTLTGAAAILLALIFKLASYKNKKYSFMIMGHALKIIHGNKEFNLPWTEIEAIDELKFGIVIKLNLLNKDFTVFDDLYDFNEFKSEIFHKAFEHGIPVKALIVK